MFLAESRHSRDADSRAEPVTRARYILTSMIEKPSDKSQAELTAEAASDALFRKRYESSEDRIRLLLEIFACPGSTGVILTSGILHNFPFTPEERASGLFDKGIDRLIRDGEGLRLLWTKPIRIRENQLTPEQRLRILRDVSDRKDGSGAFEVIEAYLSILTLEERELMIRCVLESGKGGLFFTPLFTKGDLLNEAEKQLIDFARPNKDPNIIH